MKSSYQASYQYFLCPPDWLSVIVKKCHYCLLWSINQLINEFHLLMKPFTNAGFVRSDTFFWLQMKFLNFLIQTFWEWAWKTLLWGPNRVSVGSAIGSDKKYIIQHISWQRGITQNCSLSDFDVSHQHQQQYNISIINE